MLKTRMSTDSLAIGRRYVNYKTTNHKTVWHVKSMIQS